MKNIVYQITWKHMKMNRKRTWTTFLGIFFMILLMTCVFVGRKTAVSYLQEVGSQRKGKWHISMYGVSENELEKVNNLNYVKETARSTDWGYTDFPASGNEERPYLYIKAYEKPCYDWMNLKLKEGRLPEKEGEIVISQKAVDDGGTISLGDSFKAEYFNRTITGINKDAKTIFPFQEITAEYGKKEELSQDFPFYGENDSFRIDKEYTGREEELTVVGILKQPWFEKDSAAAYSGFTCYRQEDGADFNLSIMLDLKKIPAGTDMYEELDKIAGNNKTEYNNYVLSFSGDSSDSVINFIVRVMSAFFIIVIMAAAIILIYNVFNISFEERSRYLGMLCSVGATGRQKKSSVYFEAFSLFLPAFPLGFLAGCGVVGIGMQLFQPFIYTMMSVSREVLGEVPVHLEFSWEDIVLTAAVSGLTVFLSAVLPARKISKVGPIECIRGNLEKESVRNRKRLRYTPGLGAEKLLARNSMRCQKRKTRGMKRAAAVFMVILILTVSSAQMITRLVSYRMLETDTVWENDEGWDYKLYSMANSVNSVQKFEKLKEEIKKDPGVDAVREEYSGMFIGQTSHENLSKEYWTALHNVFNLYYHRELTDEEFKEMFDYGVTTMNLIAVDRDFFREIAKAGDVDTDLLEQENSIIVIQSGEVSTENWRVQGREPEKFAFYEVEKMTDLEKGDELSIGLYSPSEEKNIELGLKIAGFATNQQLKDYFQFHSESMWGIVSLDTGDKINDILTDHENPEGTNHMMDRVLRLKVNEEAAPLVSRLQELSEAEDADYLLAPTGYTKNLAASINSIIRILLVGFVLLTSIICLLNLYNSVHGWISGQKRYFAMMASVGMTQKQIEKMLFYEAVSLLMGSSIWAVLISAPVMAVLKKGMIGRFGYVRIAFPWWIYVLGILITSIVIFAFMLYHYRRQQKNNKGLVQALYQA